METPNFFGLGQLNQVLHALDIDGLELVWTLKQSKQKISLDIVWFKTPASEKRTQETNGRVRSHQRANPDMDMPDASLDAHAKPACIQTSAATSVNTTANKRKRKSPSTKKRDKDRLEKWRAKKMSCDSVKPTHHESHLKSPPKFSSSVTVELSPTISQDKCQLPQPALDVNPPGRDILTDTKKDKPTYSQPQEHVFVQDLDITDYEHKEKFHEELESQALEEYLDSEQMNMCFNLNCLAQETTVPGGLKKCTRCSVARYCCRKCQAEHWPIHCTACGKLL